MFTLLREAFQGRCPRILVALIALWLFSDAIAAAQTPRSGGELVFAVAETPPTFDGHRETTFAMLHPKLRLP